MKRDVQLLLSNAPFAKCITIAKSVNERRAITILLGLVGISSISMCLVAKHPYRRGKEVTGTCLR